MNVGERCEELEESAKLVREVMDSLMDTPERSKCNQIGTSRKFEFSPIFNFLNSLSPIKPVKSAPVIQTVDPQFASSSSVFTSPHVSSHRESLFLRRHQLPDPSKTDFSSSDGNINKVNVDVSMILDEQKENLDPRASNCELVCEPSYDCSKLLLDFAENFSGGNDNQNCSLKPSYDCFSSAVGPLTYKTEEKLEGFGHVDRNKEATSFDWEHLISNATNLLAFESPNDTKSCEQSVDPATSFYRSIRNAIQNEQTLGAAVSGEHFRDGNVLENTSTQPGEIIEMMENSGTQDIIAGSSISNLCQKADYENHSGLCRGVRRRSLFFETGRKHVEYSSGSDSPTLLKHDENTSSDQQTVPKKTENDFSVLPGIGLYLNALAATPKDIKFVNHEASASGRMLIGPSPSASFHLPTSGQALLNNNLADYSLISLDRAIETFANGPLSTENEEINPSSPRKKKRKLEQGGEGESCKRCNCKKSKCLKLYCECFAAGVYCVEPGACIDCFNKPIHEDTVLATRKQIESRNPLAFAPKVIRGSNSLSEIRDDFSNTPASARHKRGCNCKKSGCLKKYCECYQGGGCSINCRCEGCKNLFGRKDGSVGTDHELEENETGTTALDQSMDSVPPATPLRTGRQSVEPFSSRKRPPRSSFPSTSSSSGLGKASFFPPPPPPPKFNQQFETIKEDQLPEFLQGESPVNGVNSSSPNSKRVSPPKSLEMLSGLRSRRKLLLKSIPSFPSLR